MLRTGRRFQTELRMIETGGPRTADYGSLLRPPALPTLKAHVDQKHNLRDGLTRLFVSPVFVVRSSRVTAIANEFGYRLRHRYCLPRYSIKKTLQSIAHGSAVSTRRNRCEAIAILSGEATQSVGRELRISRAAFAGPAGASRGKMSWILVLARRALDIEPAAQTIRDDGVHDMETRRYCLDPAGREDG